MTSKAQAAALNAITQRVNEARLKLRAPSIVYEDPGGPVGEPPPLSLDKVEKFSVECITEIRALVTDHSLDEKIFSEARHTILERLYEEAEHRKEYAWQAAFAKRHEL